MSIPNEYVFTSPLAGALFMKRRGFFLFPLIPNGKTPAVKDWQAWAAQSSEKSIEEYARSNPKANWGVHAIDLAVIDVDNKDGRSGSKNFQAIADANGGLEATFTVKTPTGGYHGYFKGDVKNSVGELCTHVDTRGAGGYVVAPGSRIGGKDYEIVEGGEVKPLPTWITEKLAPRKGKLVVDENELVVEGNRNSFLTKIAGGLRRLGYGGQALAQAINSFNEEHISPPLPLPEVEHITKNALTWAPETAEVQADFSLEVPKIVAQTADDFDFGSIPKRDWVMAHRYAGKYISVIVAPGGAGKSTVTMLDAVSIATGKALTGFDVVKSGAVWIYNTEDPIDEIRRRLAAISIYHGVEKGLLKNVHYTSGRDNPLILAKHTGKDGAVINDLAINECVSYIKSHSIVLMLADPFIRTHLVQENDNGQIDLVAQAFQRIADRTGCAIGLVHHTSKAGSNAQSGDANKARGASSLISAARVVNDISTMTPDEAKKFNIDEDRRGFYLRLDNSKGNMHAPASSATWFEKHTVMIPNGDEVGTVELCTDLVDAASEKKDQKREGDKLDLGRFLIKIMKVGEPSTCDNVFKLLTENNSYAHLFERVKTERAGTRMISEIIGADGIILDGLSFKLVRTSGRKPHIACELSNSGPSRLDELDRVGKKIDDYKHAAIEHNFLQ